MGVPVTLMMMAHDSRGREHSFGSRVMACLLTSRNNERNMTTLLARPGKTTRNNAKRNITIMDRRGPDINARKPAGQRSAIAGDAK